MATTDCASWAKPPHGEKGFQSQTAALGTVRKTHAAGALAECRAPRLLTLEAAAGFSCLLHCLYKDGN